MGTSQMRTTMRTMAIMTMITKSGTIVDIIDITGNDDTSDISI